jgi:ADP-ribose pyrophosphatase YjhB (NUDIX family)
MKPQPPFFDIQLLLARSSPHATEEVVWGERMRLHATAYLSNEAPPLPCVTSVRAVVLRDGAVLVQQDRDSRHILPGGRREANESLEDTLRREVGEETGWSVSSPGLLGFIHFHHLDPKPADYAYPHPDFFQVVYGAHADAFSAAALVDDGYEEGTEFVALTAISLEELKPIERVFLSAAINRSTETADPDATASRDK